MTIKTILAAALAIAATPASAAQHVLDFSGAICGDGSEACGFGIPIAQSYGDVPGMFDVSYASLPGVEGSPAPDTLWPWTITEAGSYSGLANVAYARNADAIGRITLTPFAGVGLTLTALTFGSYNGVSRASSLQIIADGVVVNGLGAFNVAAPPQVFALSTTAYNALVITWGPDAFNVGIDNVTFTSDVDGGSTVPEPASWALLIAGFGLTGAAMRRRRIAAVA